MTYYVRKSIRDSSLCLLFDDFSAYLFFILFSGAIGYFDDGISPNIDVFLCPCKFLKRLGLWIAREFF